MANPQPGIEVTDPARYQARTLDRLSGRDPVEVLTQTPDLLTKIVQTHSADTLRRRPFEGKWTPAEVIGHLVDTEWVYGFRLRVVLCEERPTVLGMNQELWVVGQKHNEREPAELVETFAALRKANLVLWRRLTPEQLARVGVHNERGPETLELMRRLSAGHDISHLDQINRYIAAVEAARK